MVQATTSDPAAMERDLDETRARLDTRLTELASRLSPGQIVDETLGMLRTREGADFARNLGEAVREKPIPAALVGIGIAWLMAGPRDHAVSGMHGVRPMDAEPDLMTRAWNAGRDLVRNTDETDIDYRGRVTEARGSVLGVTRGAQDTAESYADRVQEALFAARNRASEAVSGAADQLSAMGRRASDAAQGMTDAMRARAHDVRDQASGLGAAVADQARGLRDGMGSSGVGNGSLGGLASAIGENPALLGAVGLAAGALLGALLPVTEFEREHLGDAVADLRASLERTVRTASDRGAEVARSAMDAGRETAREAVRHASEVAGKASEAAKDVAGSARDNAAAVSSGAAEAARSVGEKAGSAAQRAGG